MTIGGLVELALRCGAPDFSFMTGVGLAPYIFGGLVLLPAAFFLFVILTAMWERQHLSGDVEPTQEPFPYTPSPYWQATREEALRLGLRHAGDFATRKKTSVVKGLQSLFISPDNHVIASIVAASFAGAPLKKTVLRSRLQDGRVLESSDNPGLGDFSRLIEREVLLHAGLAELIPFHLQRIANSRSTPLPFNSQGVLEAFERVDLDKGARWVQLGLARWVDPRQTSLRLTLRGALAHLKQGYLRDSDKLKAQQHRMHIRRAGSRPG